MFARTRRSVEEPVSNQAAVEELFSSRRTIGPGLLAVASGCAHHAHLAILAREVAERQAFAGRVQQGVERGARAHGQRSPETERIFEKGFDFLNGVALAAPSAESRPTARR